MRKPGLSRQSTVRIARNIQDSTVEVGSGDGLANRLHIQTNNPRSWFNQWREQSPLLGNRKKTNNENVSMSSNLNSVSTPLAAEAGMIGEKHLIPWVKWNQKCLFKKSFKGVFSKLLFYSQFLANLQHSGGKHSRRQIAQFAQIVQLANLRENERSIRFLP